VVSEAASATTFHDHDISAYQTSDDQIVSLEVMDYSPRPRTEAVNRMNVPAIMWGRGSGRRQVLAH